VTEQLKSLIADMKTMDTGAFETEMASKAGADIVCILAASDNSTIADAIKSARKYGSKIMVDLIGVNDKIQRAKELESLGVDYFCIHVGIDEQMIGKNPIKVLSSLVKTTNIPIAVAGGLNSKTAVDAVKAGAQVIIVGGAITKAKDVTKATKQIKQAIETQKPVDTTLFKKYDKTQLKEAFSLASTPNISDAMHKQGAMQDIRPVKPGFRMVGRALTVRTIDGDWAKPVEAIDKAETGQVIVVDVNGGKTAIWGELATWSAKGKGLAGAVIDGAVRDLDDLVKIDFPIFSRHVSPNAGEPKGFGEIGAEITCGSEIANRALDVKEHENRIREEIKDGGSLASVLKLRKWEKKVG